MATNVAGWSSVLQYFLSIRGYLVGEKVHAYLIRVLYSIKESCKTRSGGDSEIHCIGIKFSLQWRTRRSIHGSGNNTTFTRTTSPKNTNAADRSSGNEISASTPDRDS